MRDDCRYGSTIPGLAGYAAPNAPNPAQAPAYDATAIGPRWRTMCTIIEVLCQEGPIWHSLVYGGADPAKGDKLRTKNVPRMSIDQTILGRDARNGKIHNNRMAVHLSVARPRLNRRIEDIARGAPNADWFKEFRVETESPSAIAGGIAINASHVHDTVNQHDVIGNYVMPNYLHMYTELCRQLSPGLNLDGMIHSCITPYEFLLKLMVGCKHWDPNTTPVPPALVTSVDLEVQRVGAWGGVAPQPVTVVAGIPHFTSLYLFMRCSRYMLHSCCTEMSYFLLNRPALEHHEQWRNRVRYALQLLGYNVIPTTLLRTPVGGAPAAIGLRAPKINNRDQEIEMLIRYFKCPELKRMIDYTYPSHLSDIIKVEEVANGSETSLPTYLQPSDAKEHLIHHEWRYGYIQRGAVLQYAIGLFHPHHRDGTPWTAAAAPVPANKPFVFSWAKKGPHSRIHDTLAPAGPSVPFAADGTNLANSPRGTFFVFDDILLHDTAAAVAAPPVEPGHMFAAYMQGELRQGHTEMPWGGQFRRVMRSMMTSNLQLRPDTQPITFRAASASSFIPAGFKRRFPKLSGSTPAHKRQPPPGSSSPVTFVDSQRERTSDTFLNAHLWDALFEIARTGTFSVSMMSSDPECVDDTFEGIAEMLANLSGMYPEDGDGVSTEPTLGDDNVIRKIIEVEMPPEVLSDPTERERKETGIARMLTEYMNITDEIPVAEAEITKAVQKITSDIDPATPRRLVFSPDALTSPGLTAA